MIFNDMAAMEGTLLSCVSELFLKCILELILSM
jgi:hypothetical protein